MSKSELAERVYIITGATSGMGRGIARLFAEEGAHLILSGRDLDRGNELVKELHDQSGKVIYLPGDVRESDYNRKLVETAQQQFGGLDGVVTNAGVLGLGRLTELELSEWRATMETNLDSVFYLLKFAIPAMLQRGRGAVVINASIAAYKNFPNHAAYCASKAGVLSLARQAAVDYGPEIRINAICPGPVDTPLIHASAAAFPDPLQAVEDAGRNTLMQRLGLPKDIAQLVRFLISDDASWITGASFTIDGGATAKG